MLSILLACKNAKQRCMWTGKYNMKTRKFAISMVSIKSYKHEACN